MVDVVAPAREGARNADDRRRDAPARRRPRVPRSQLGGVAVARAQLAVAPVLAPRRTGRARSRLLGRLRSGARRALPDRREDVPLRRRRHRSPHVRRLPVLARHAMEVPREREDDDHRSRRQGEGRGRVVGAGEGDAPDADGDRPVRAAGRRDVARIRAGERRELGGSADAHDGRDRRVVRLVRRRLADGRGARRRLRGRGDGVRRRCVRAHRGARARAARFSG